MLLSFVLGFVPSLCGICCVVLLLTSQLYVHLLAAAVAVAVAVAAVVVLLCACDMP